MNTKLPITVLFLFYLCLTSTINYAQQSPIYESSYTQQSPNTISGSWKNSLVPVPDDNLDIFDAVKNNNVSQLKYLLTHGSTGIDNKNKREHDFTALHMAVHNGSTNMVSILLVNNAKVDPQDNKGNTPLAHAAHKGHIDIANILISHGADINQSNTSQSSSLHWAAHNGHLNVGNVLLANKVKTNIIDKNGHSPLWCALKYISDNREDSHGLAFINLLLDDPNHPGNTITDFVGRVFSPDSKPEQELYELIEKECSEEKKEYRFNNHNISKQEAYQIVLQKPTQQEIAINNEIIKKEQKKINRDHNILFCKLLEDLAQHQNQSQKPSLS